MKSYYDYMVYRPDDLNKVEQRRYDEAVRDHPDDLDQAGPRNSHLTRLGLNDASFDDRFKMQVALQRARETLKHFDMPETEDCFEKFPDVDPEGKFCEVDMDFSRRLKTVQAEALRLGLDFRAQVGKMDGTSKVQMQNHSSLGIYQTDFLADCRKEMVESCQNIRLYQRAAKLSCSRKDYNTLNDAAKNIIENDPAIRKYDEVLSFMEACCAIKPMKKSYPRELLSGFGTISVANARVSPYEAYEHSRDARYRKLDLDNLKDPMEVNVNHYSFRNVLRQKWFSNPQHWVGHLPPDTSAGIIKTENISKQDLDGMFYRYACSGVHSSINGAFARVERTFRSPLPDGVNRGNLISINGKTINELMFSEYQKGHPEASSMRDDGYKEWYQKNCLRKTNEYVSAAAVNPRMCVEAFIPDSSGELPKRPLAITSRGVEPAKLEKVVLNAWERHFAKRGFYKEKALKAELYQSTVDRQQRIKDLYYEQTRGACSNVKGDTPLRYEYVKDKAGENSPNTVGSFHAIQRNSFVFMCAAALSDDYSFGELLTPGLHLEEKRKMGNQFLAHMNAQGEEAVSARDDWLAKATVKGYENLNKEVNAMLNDGRLLDPNWRKENRAVLGNMALFFTEMESSAPSVHDRMDQLVTQKDPTQFDSQKLTNKASYSANFLNCLVLGDKARSRINQPDYHPTPNQLKDDLLNLYAGEHAEQMLKDNAGKPIHRRSTYSPEFIAAMGQQCQNQLGKKLDNFFSDPKVADRLVQVAKAGKLDRLFSMTPPEKQPVKLDARGRPIKPMPKFEYNIDHLQKVARHAHADRPKEVKARGRGL